MNSVFVILVTGITPLLSLRGHEFSDLNLEAQTKLLCFEDGVLVSEPVRLFFLDFLDNVLGICVKVMNLCYSHVNS